MTNPPMRIYRDVGGVMGLHLATNAFSEEIESSLQNETVLIAPLGKKRSSKNSGFFPVKTDVKEPGRLLIFQGIL